MKTNNDTTVPKVKLILEWLIHMITYAVILLLISLFSKTIVIDKDCYILYSLLAALIIYVLNKTIKPILFEITVPITGITMGLFYPCINVLILKITDWILLNHFDTHGIISLFLTAILISFMYIVVDELIIEPILKGVKKNE